MVDSFLTAHDSKAIDGFLMGSPVFTSALILALAWTYATEFRGRKVSLFVISLPVEYLPWALFGFSVVRDGWDNAICGSTGMVAAHLFDTLTRLYPSFQGGKNWLQTPGFIARAFGANMNQPARTGYGSMQRPTGRATRETGFSSGWTSSLDHLWAGRNVGRRLGGE